MANRFGERLLGAGSRLKRSLHRATEPRSSALTRREVDRLIGLLFPTGLGADSLNSVRLALQDHDLTASTLRSVIGGVDQHLSPSPFSVGMSREDLAFVAVGGIDVALDRADRSVSASIIESGTWEPHVERVLRQYLVKGSVFVDIGANVGWHTMLAASIVGDAAAVYAFEPNPANARLIAHTIEKNRLPNVHLLPFALSDRVGFSSFQSAIGSNGAFVGSREHDSLDASVTIVPTLRLDDLSIEHVDVLKIDVEGAEPLVLRGAEATIERDHPVIIFEFSCDMSERVGGDAARTHLDMLQARGYELALIEQPTGELLPIGDVGELLAGWGSRFRTEDILAVHR